MKEKPGRYDYILIAVLLSSSYAISHLAGANDVYMGVWMLLMAITVCLWFFVEGLANIGKAIVSKVPWDKDKDKEDEEDAKEED